MKTAYWNHTPLLLVTPQAANKTIGQGGFQEVEQMKLFEDMVAYQEEVRDPSRMAEVLTRVIAQAKRLLGPGADQRAARFLDPGASTSTCPTRSNSKPPRAVKTRSRPPQTAVAAPRTR